MIKYFLALILCLVLNACDNTDIDSTEIPLPEEVVWNCSYELLSVDCNYISGLIDLDVPCTHPDSAIIFWDGNRFELNEKGIYGPLPYDNLTGLTLRDFGDSINICAKNIGINSERVCNYNFIKS